MIRPCDLKTSEKIGVLHMTRGAKDSLGFT
jgi:hypothetical protein